MRLDGSTQTTNRQRSVNAFNRKNTASIFLISTKAGCLGINLIGANRVILFDPSWNPTNDLQVCK